MIEGVFEESIFDEAAFEMGEVEAFAEERETIEASFAQDHGPMSLLPEEIAARRRLWLKFLRDWRDARRAAKRRRDLEALALFSLVTDGQVGL